MGPGIKWCQSVRCQWICLSPSSNLQFTGMSSLTWRGLERSWKSNRDLDQNLGSFWGLWPHWQEVLKVFVKKQKTSQNQGFVFDFTTMARAEAVHYQGSTTSMFHSYSSPGLFIKLNYRLCSTADTGCVGEMSSCSGKQPDLGQKDLAHAHTHHVTCIFVGTFISTMHYPAPASNNHNQSFNPEPNPNPNLNTILISTLEPCLNS